MEGIWAANRAAGWLLAAVLKSPPPERRFGGQGFTKAPGIRTPPAKHSPSLLPPPDELRPTMMGVSAFRKINRRDNRNPVEKVGSRRFSLAKGEGEPMTHDGIE